MMWENLSRDSKYLIHFPAIYLLAFFRETRAYESIIRIASLSDEQIVCLLGDMVTEDFKNIIASVCDGNIGPIKSIIEDSSLNEYVRSQALQSLLILLNYGMVSREALVSYFKELINGKLEEDYSCVWDELPLFCALIHPKGLKEDIDKAVADGKIMEIIANLDFVDDQLKKGSVGEVLDELKKDEDYAFISKEDVNELEEWLDAFSDDDDDYDDDDYDDDDDDDYNDDDDYDDDDYDDDDDDDDYDDDDDDDEGDYDNGNETEAAPFMRDFDERRNNEVSSNVPFRRESFIGRNDPCPCGSGKKYKKCCGK